MNRNWAQRWIKLLADRTDELVGLYADQFEFEDVVLGVHIQNDKAVLRQFFSTFANPDPAKAYNNFEVFHFVGDERLCAVQWLWDAKHAGDVLGVPAAGKVTVTRGMTTLAFRDGKIALARAMWDVAPVLRQLGVLPRL